MGSVLGPLYFAIKTIYMKTTNAVVPKKLEQLCFHFGTIKLCYQTIPKIHNFTYRNIYIIPRKISVGSVLGAHGGTVYLLSKKPLKYEIYNMS